MRDIKSSTEMIYRKLAKNLGKTIGELVKASLAWLRDVVSAKSKQELKKARDQQMTPKGTESKPEERISLPPQKPLSK